MQQNKDKAKDHLPVIDERVVFHGTSFLRTLNTEQLRDLDGLIVLRAENGDRLAVIINYQEYLLLQSIALSLRQWPDQLPKEGAQ